MTSEIGVASYDAIPLVQYFSIHVSDSKKVKRTQARQRMKVWDAKYIDLRHVIVEN